MMENTFRWKKSSVILIILGALVILLPARPIDPWNLISLKKVSTLIFTLSFLQVIGSFLLSIFGHKKGALMTGFLGGLVSSTATTVSLAHQSKQYPEHPTETSILTFLTATLAMLFEGLLITLLGSDEHKYSFIIIFIGPALYVLFNIRRTSQKIVDTHTQDSPSELKLFTLIKLTLFILTVLSLSKIIQNIVGGNALLLLTFIVSLFEIHGSLIANIQLHDSGSFSNLFLGSLIAISISATFVSKLFLVRTLGSQNLIKQITRITMYLFLSLLISWMIFWSIHSMY